MAEKKKVLVAEDSSVIQNLTKKILQAQNCEIYGAKNGQDVLSKMENEAFDLILMDINMPVMDGIECARNIRQMEDGKKANIPIFAITGNAHNYTQEDYAEVGINEYLPKPLNFDDLVQKVKKWTS